MRGVCLLVAAALALAACARKTEVKPPQLVAPHVVGEVSLTTLVDGVAVRWARPTKYVDGTEMEDLGGFVVDRSRNNESFEELARVPVTDRGRFQKTTRFEHVDHAVMEGTTYHYRIVAFTTDGYYSAPSGAATITWEPPHPSPSPGATPAVGASPRARRGATKGR
ncbi:MAG: hypothetical protein HY271_12160 [Deltaproteobacteria bacterium]|nr:hypothetical protein [Deltaproteobacteria bacterium]